MKIETTAASEQVIAENLSIFEENGFRISIEEEERSSKMATEEVEEQPRKKFKLLSIPIYKGIEFGINDVNELASLILDGHEDSVLDNRNSKDYLSVKNDNLRGSSSMIENGMKKSYILPKLMAAFASKACRQAIMIGTALNEQQMEKIVHQLVGIEQPWNCPHGRPTLRHLLDLKELNQLKLQLRSKEV